GFAAAFPERADELIAVARLLLQQRERHQAQFLAGEALAATMAAAAPGETAAEHLAGLAPAAVAHPAPALETMALHAGRAFHSVHVSFSPSPCGCAGDNALHEHIKIYLVIILYP